MTTSPELTGGTGFSFEDRVTAQYLASLLLAGEAPGIDDRQVVRVAVQQAGFGEPLDDLVVDFKGTDGSEARLALQVKRATAIGRGDEAFSAIIALSWESMASPRFRDGHDRVGGAIEFAALSTYRPFLDLLAAARASETSQHFEQRFARGGTASRPVHHARQEVEAILVRAAGRTIDPAELHRFLRHLLLLRFDHLHDGASDPPAVIAALRSALDPSSVGQASLVWDRLCRIARDAAGTAAELHRTTIVRKLSSVVALAASPWLAGDITKLTQLARDWSRDITRAVGTTHIPRPRLDERLAEELSAHRFVAIRGLPGTGKSVLLRYAIDKALTKGPTLFLKHDRLEGNGWSAFAGQFRIEASDLEALLVELGAVGVPTLFVDGIDRLEIRHRAIVADIVRTITNSRLLDNWKIITTLRDGAIEALSTWLPELFTGDGFGAVLVEALDDNEAIALAEAEPQLSALLSGPPAVREIVRRPFFARILAQNFCTASSATSTSFAPQSEIDLIDHWWRRGGYDAEGREATRRQRALLALGALRARHLSGAIRLSDLAPDTIDMIDTLKADGIIQDVRPGHSVAFAHDIFFEWAFFEHLVSADGDWIAQLAAAGEPPMLGRVVELLSQAEYNDEVRWTHALAELEASRMRSQWTRAWLLGPLSLDDYDTRGPIFERVYFADEYRRLHQVMVWFQAERTIPNFRILEVLDGRDMMNAAARQRAADHLALPSDIGLWSRFLRLLMDDKLELPVTLYPDLLALFEVWQNLWADTPNPVSEAIVAYVGNWLVSIDDEQDPEHIRRWGSTSSWSGLPGRFDEFSKGARNLFMRAARSYPAKIDTYLEMLGKRPRLLSTLYQDIIRFSVVLADVLPARLVDLTLTFLCRELPEDAKARRAREAKASAARRARARAKPEEERTREHEFALSSLSVNYGHDHHHDWRDLAIGDGPIGFFPASPFTEPFHALFERAPDEAMRLVRETSNHAVRAWRQLARIDAERQSTPIPFQIEFPWGTQQFWGGVREYHWSRGIRAPAPIATAYLALAHWAFAELDRGADVDALIKRVVAGHDGIAVLGVAVALTLESGHVSDATEALVRSPRLWRADDARWRSEIEWVSANRGGFKDKPEAEREAAEALHGRRAYRYDLASFSPHILFGSDEVRAQGLRMEIEGFTPDMLFERQEERESDERRAALDLFCRSAKSWTNPDNLRRVPAGDGAGPDHIVHRDPATDDTDMAGRVAEAQDFLAGHRLFQWARSSIETGAIGPAISRTEARTTADKIGGAELFEEADEQHVAAGAVAATAAALLAFPSDEDSDCDGERAWALALILAATQSKQSGDISSVRSASPWHPLRFVGHGLAAEIRCTGNEEAAVLLLQLVTHPIEEISLEALGCSLGLWDVNPRFAWAALGLALLLCRNDEARPRDSDVAEERAEDRRRVEAAGRALAAYREGKDDFPALPPLPRAWVRNNAPKRRPEDGDWIRPPGYWDTRHASSILERTPVTAILASPASKPFLAYMGALIRWTCACIAPAWAREHQDLNRDAGRIEWRLALGQMAGQLAGQLPVAETGRIFLNPVKALPDKACFGLLSPFARALICCHVYDAPELGQPPVPLFDAMLDRLRTASPFNPSAYRAGRVENGDMMTVARCLFLVLVTDAPGAARFANGDWNDLTIFLPVVDRMVRSIGWSADVLSVYLTLAEEAQATYPVDDFADQILAQFDKTPDAAIHWRDRLIAARIAGLVQHFSERDAPLVEATAQKLLHILDRLVDVGDRRSAALQLGEAFRDVRLRKGNAGP